METNIKLAQKTQPSLDAYQPAMHYQMGGLIVEHRSSAAKI
ncbi:MAG: hypothetical protein ABI234_14705 [Ktedonobacteraceae bacterium]